MTFQQEFVVDKLTFFKSYQKELATILKLSSDKELLNSSVLLSAAERFFQLMVDLMIDVNQHFIRELNLEVPEDLFSTFIVLGEHNILNKKFAQKLAPIVGTRNRLVHQYEKVNQTLFLTNLRKNFTDFDTYQNQISRYLESMD